MKKIEKNYKLLFFLSIWVRILGIVIGFFGYLGMGLGFSGYLGFGCPTHTQAQILQNTH